MEPYAMIQVSILLQPHRTVIANFAQTISVCFGGNPVSHSLNLRRNRGWKHCSNVIFLMCATLQGRIQMGMIDLPKTYEN